MKTAVEGISVYVTVTEKKKLKRLARRRNRSMAWFLRRAIKQAIKEDISGRDLKVIASG